MFQENTTITTFADDNTPLVGGTTQRGDNAIRIIHQLEEHFTSKNLLLNQIKTNELLLQFTNEPAPQELPGITRANTVKVIGVIFDHKLTFKEHISTICRNISSRIFLLLRLKRLNYSQNELEHLCGALVKSVISYASPVWECAAKSDSENIDRLYKSAVRKGIIRNYDPASEIMKEAEVTLFNKVTKMGIIHQLYRFIPQRSANATTNLRERMPCVAIQGELNIFPNRLLCVELWSA